MRESQGEGEVTELQVVGKAPTSGTGVVKQGG